VKGKRLLVTHKFEVSYWWDRFEAYYAPFFDRIEAIPITWIYEDTRYWKRYDDMVNAGLAGWLEDYDLVVLVDGDEFVIPNPDKYRDLGDYLDRFTVQIVRTYGFGVIELPDDAPLDQSGKILDQRKYWYHDPYYNKPIVTRVPAVYEYGFHNCNIDAEVDPDLVMFHLRDADLVNLDKFAPSRNPKNFTCYKDIPDYDERLAIAELIPDKWMGLL
jgi:hypothetical protein